MVSYRVEFLVSGYAGVPVLYNESNGLVGIASSAQKTGMNNNFDQEPDRVEIEILLDDWLEENLVNAPAIRENIGVYDVKVYSDEILDFRGVIALDSLEYEYPAKVLKMRAYSYLYLMILEKDATYFPANRTLDVIMSGLSQKVSQRYDRTLNFMDKDLHYTFVQKVDYPLYEIASTFELGYVERSCDVGFDSYRLPFHDNAIIIRFRRIDWGISQYQGRYFLRMTSFVAEISNQVCIDMDIQRNSIGEYSSLAGARAAIETTKEEYPEHYESTAWIGRREYSFLEIYGTSYKVSPDNREITITGKVLPTSLVLKKEDRTYLNALKCFLVIHNLTIVKRASDGYLRIVRNNWGGVDHGDLSQSVVSCKAIRNFKQIMPDYKALDSLYNSADVLKRLLTEYYTSIANNSLKYQVVIDDVSTHNLQLFDKIRINGEQLFITELEKNYKKDEYKIIAWRIND